MSIASMVLAGLLAMGFIFLRTATVHAVAPIRAMAAHVGFSPGAYRVIGVLEIAGVAGLLIGLTVPLVGGLAGAGLFLLLTGALMTHLRNGDRVRRYAPAAALCAVLVVVYLVALYGASR
jgi:hypothetical protein